MAEFHYSQNDLAQVIGKSRSHVANTLRLLRLPDSIKRQVNDGILSAGHARALLSVRDPEAVAERIIAQGLNVRDVERIAQEEARGSEEAASRQARPRREKDPDTRALEQALEEVLGLAVSVEHKAQGGGEVRIRYKTLEQLDALCRRLRG